jgi:hypothetical protein
MNRLFLIMTIVLLAFSFILAGCTGGEKEEPAKDSMATETTDTSMDTDATESEPVVTDQTTNVATEATDDVDVSFLQDYKNCELVKKDVASPAHMNAIKDVYVNSIGIEAFKAGSVPFPAGTIITKENYANESGAKGALQALTCMVKMEAGYDPDNGDWAYVSTGADAAVQEKGKLAMCIECHTKEKDKDYVFLSGQK